MLPNGPPVEPRLVDGRALAVWLVPLDDEGDGGFLTGTGRWSDGELWLDSGGGRRLPVDPRWWSSLMRMTSDLASETPAISGCEFLVIVPYRTEQSVAAPGDS